MGLFKKRKDAREEKAKLESELNILINEKNSLSKDISALNETKEDLTRQNRELVRQNRDLTEKTKSRMSPSVSRQDEYRQFEQAKDSLIQEAAMQERRKLARAREQLGQEKDDLARRWEQLNRRELDFDREYSHLQDEYRQFEQEKDDLIQEAAMQERRKLARERELLGQERESLIRERTAFEKEKLESERKEASLEKYAPVPEKKSSDSQEAQTIEPKPLAPTFDKYLFSDIPLASALLNYDYINNSRLFSALSEEISLSRSIFDVEFIAFSKSSGNRYVVTLSGCTCPDYVNRRQPCKHMYRLAVALGWVAQSREEEIKLKLAELERIQAKVEKSSAALDKKRNTSELNLERQKKELDSEKSKFDAFVENESRKLAQERQDLDDLIKNTSEVYPFLAGVIADFQYKNDIKLGKALLHRSRPARKAAQEVQRISKEKRDLLVELKMCQYRLSMYEAAAYWLKDFDLSAEDLKEALTAEIAEDTEEYTSMRDWLSPDEYANLSTVDKYQLALDRYKRRNKSNWAAGIEYERYIGYLYEQNGFKVKYFGALNGLEDLGRDLIAVRDFDVHIIQCKRWSASKIVHEKHVFQLFGSTFDYRMQHRDQNVTGCLIATCGLSDIAGKYAEELHIVYKNIPFDQDYPMIKCNISPNGKIYHLPFDLQYDRVVIDYSSGEFYAHTVKEAEDAGFVRAKRWRSNVQ